MNRVLRWALLSIGLASAVTVIFVAPGLATPPSGLTNVLVALGLQQSHGSIPLQFGTNVVMSQITVNPGGSSGWHSHPGGAIIVVAQGTLTKYHGGSTGCEVATYSAGQA